MLKWIILGIIFWVIAGFSTYLIIQILDSNVRDTFDSWTFDGHLEPPEKPNNSTTKNDLGVEFISRDSAIKALNYNIESFEFKSGVSKHMDDIAKLLSTIYEIQVNNIKALPSVTPQEPRTEWEQDHAILKAYSDGVNEALDKIRAEIEEHAKINQNLNTDRVRALCWCLDIIDKYMGESEAIWKKIEVWIVTYWDNNQEPTVTAFDNEYNANKCYLYFKSTHVNCIMDKTYLYNKFSVSTLNRT